MRPGPNPKRSRGRNGRRPNNNSVPSRNQTFDSNGPEVRIRGNAYQVHEKYLALARDAQSSGDRIMAENYLQHAEHYYRIIAAMNEQQNDQQRRNFQPEGGAPFNPNGGPRQDGNRGPNGPNNGRQESQGAGNGGGADDQDDDEDDGGDEPRDSYTY